MSMLLPSLPIYSYSTSAPGRHHMALFEIVYGSPGGLFGGVPGLSMSMNL